MLSLFLLAMSLPLVSALGGPRRVMPLLGGRQDATGQIGRDEEPVVFAVQAINDWYASNQSSQLPRTLVKILKAETQVVSGQKVYLTLQLSTQQPQAKDEICNIIVVFRPWVKGAERLVLNGQPECSSKTQGGTTDSTDANKHNNQAGRKAPHLLGSPQAVRMDALPEDASGALNFAVAEVNRRSNNLFAFTLGNLDMAEVTQQIVAGKLFHFKGVPLHETRCGKMADFTATANSQCLPAEGGQTMVCDLKVWWQAWRRPQYTLEDFNGNSCKLKHTTVLQ